MDYVIRNHKNLYIRLNKNGAPVTCSEHEKMTFEQSKAKNILDSLPKNLKKLKFRVEAIPEIRGQANKEAIDIINKYMIQTNNYELSENVSRWVDRFGSCYDVLKDAATTSSELIKELEKLDRELLDILHRVEMEASKDLYGGWIIYKEIKENRKKRRIAKDEMLIINNVIERIDPSCLDRERVQRAIDGLFERKYRFRIVEEEETNAV